MFTRTTLMFTGTTWSLLELFWCLLDIHSSSKYSSIEYSSIDSLPPGSGLCIGSVLTLEDYPPFSSGRASQYATDISLFIVT